MSDNQNYPVAWLHDQSGPCGPYSVIHDEVKALWLKAKPQQVEHYTIPLYQHPDRKPLSTELASALLTSLGYDPMLDGNMLKILRAGEQVHGIRGVPNDL